MSDQQQMNEFFGDVDYSGRKFETWKLNPKGDDSLILSPLPAMKSLVARGDLGVYYKLHYGYPILDSDGKTRQRPFLCIEERRDGKVVVHCDACTERQSYRDKESSIQEKIKSIEAVGRQKGKTPQEIRTVRKKFEDELVAVQAWLYEHGCDGKFRMPCMNKQGQFGVFMVPWNLLKDFREQLRTLSARGIDPIGNSKNGFKGVWFEFKRVGRPSPTSDKCLPVRIARDDGSEMIDFRVMDFATAKRAHAAIPDLVEDMERRRITEDQISALVRGSGDPDENTRILGITYGNGTAASAPANDNGDSDWDSQPVVTVASNLVAPTPTASTQAPPSAASPAPTAAPVTAKLTDQELDSIFA